jgi:hypothetical protein
MVTSGYERVIHLGHERRRYDINPLNFYNKYIN